MKVNPETRALHCQGYSVKFYIMLLGLYVLQLFNVCCFFDDD